MLIRTQSLNFLQHAFVAWKNKSPIMWKKAKERIEQFLYCVPRCQFEQIRSWALKMCRIILLTVVERCAAAGQPFADAQPSVPRPSGPAAGAAATREVSTQAGDVPEEDLPQERTMRLSEVPKAWKTFGFVMTLKKMQNEMVKVSVWSVSRKFRRVHRQRMARPSTTSCSRTPRHRSFSQHGAARPRTCSI